MSLKNSKKHRKIKLKPIYPIATFIPTRKRLDLLAKFQICFADLFPPGAKLTGNERGVLFMLRGVAVGNRAAIDEEKIAEISGIRQPNVARAIAGLRKKGVITKTWMEAGQEGYRNIYELWMPPKISERDSKAERDEKRKKKAEKKASSAKLAFDPTCQKCHGTGWDSVSSNEARRCSCNK